MRHSWLLVVISVSLWLCPCADAEVLCRDQSGGVFVRGACRKAETRLNTSALGLVGPPGPKGEKGERGPRGQQGLPGNSGTIAPQQLEPMSAGETQTRPLWWLVWILTGTAIVVGFYTFEKHALRREAQTQAELQLRPFVIFAPTEGKEFCVRNIGSNTALNVKVGTFTLSPSPPVMAAFPRPVPFLRTGEGQLLQVRTTTAGGEVVTDDALFALLRPMSESFAEPEGDLFRPTITIEFENVNGRRYFVRESLLHGDMEIMNSGPVTPPDSGKLSSVWPTLQVAWQRLWAAGQKLKWRKKEGVTESTAGDEKDWGDGH